MNYRQSLFFIIVGTNGTGKTTLLNKLINEKGGKALIVDPDGLEWQQVEEIRSEQAGELKSGQAKILFPQPEDIENLMEYQNGSLVLDDCRFYLRSRLDESIRRILIRRRHNSIDVFAVMGITNDKDHLIKVRDEVKYDYLLNTVGKSREEIFKEVDSILGN